MDPNPFRTVRGLMDAVPLAKWGAILASCAGAVFFALLLPVIYLAVDHLDWKGWIPDLATLPPAQQASFVVRVPAGENPSAAWQQAVHDKFEVHVGHHAAQSYIATDAGAVTPTGVRLGILSLLARASSGLGSNLVSTIARNMPWTWQPPNANNNYLTTLFAAAIVLLLLHGLCTLAADYLAAVATLDAGMRLRRSLYAHSTRLGLLAVKPPLAEEAADLFTTKVETIQDGLRAWLRNNVVAPMILVLLLVMLFISNPGLSLCFVVAGLLVWLVLGQTAARFAREGRLAARRTEARMAQMRESVSSLQLVKSYLMDRFSQTRLERQLTDYSRAEWRRLRGLALSRPALMSAVALVAVGVLYLAGRNVLFGQMNLAGLAFKIVAVTFLVWAVRSWIAGRIRIRKAIDAAGDVAEFLDRRVDPGQAIDAEFLQPLRKKLEVAAVTVKEPGGGRVLLDNVSFAVPAGARVAMVASHPDEGRALLSLLGRFVEPAGGDVRFDGKNIRWVTLESLRTQVATIAQPLTVFTDTVSNNIGCGDPSFPPPQVIDAAKLAHAHQFVQRLPYGYETVIGDGGYALRSGEKMRIALARALLRDPSLIVVEEPGEVMDVDSQTLLDDTFERARAGRTLIFLTHRESVLRHADHVIVLHKSQVVASGKHHELMESNELYRRLVFKELVA